jgi:hypothetical protein
LDPPSPIFPLNYKNEVIRIEMYCVRDIHQKLQTMKGLALDSLMAL